MKKAAKILLILECAVLVLCAVIIAIMGISLMVSLKSDGTAGGAVFFLYAVLVLIPLAWNIPFIKKINRAEEGCDVLSVGFKVCVLLLCGWIPGILLLLDQD